VSQWFPTKPRKNLKAFSLVSNTRQLFKINKSESTISCVDGLKGISGEKLPRKRFEKLLISEIF
jgi:hypothetical protein